MSVSTVLPCELPSKVLVKAQLNIVKMNGHTEELQQKSHHLFNFNFQSVYYYSVVSWQGNVVYPNH